MQIQYFVVNGQNFYNTKDHQFIKKRLSRYKINLLMNTKTNKAFNDEFN